MNKTCLSCNCSKEQSDFKKAKQTASGFANICKQCYNIRNRIYNKCYRQTPSGFADRIWYGIRKRCGNKDGQSPAYQNVKLKMTKKEFLTWAVPKYEKWFNENPEIKPSINRINPLGHYEIANLEIISLDENCKLSRSPSIKIFVARVINKCQESNCSYDDFINEFIHQTKNPGRI